MKLKEIINKSFYGTISYIETADNLLTLESYIQYNFEVIKQFKGVIVAANYKNNEKELIDENRRIWEKYFPECVIINSTINRGHNFGTADLDNNVFDYCKKNNIKWVFKTATDFIFNEHIFDIEIDNADFYYLNGISYEDLYLNKFDYGSIYKKHFYPQTNSYFIDVSKCDYLNDSKYLDETYELSKNIQNYNGKIWEYIKDWSCENFLKECVERNNLEKFYLLDYNVHTKLCEAINQYKIGDPSHKNIFINGVCHFQYPEHPVIEIY